MPGVSGGRLDHPDSILASSGASASFSPKPDSKRLVPLGSDDVVLTSTAAFETSFGHEYLSVAVSRIVGVGDRLDPLRGPLAGAEVRGLTIARAGGREREHRVLVGVEFGCQDPRRGPRCSGSD